MDAHPGRKNLCTSMFFCLIPAFLSACGGIGPAVQTPFMPPTAQNPPAPIVLATPLPPGPTPTPTCTADLHFVQDLTIPDGTAVLPGSSLDKQWQVQNSGSCNWDGRYRVHFIGGDALGAPAEQALYPARSGTQAVIRMTFTAPANPGSYYSEWQAYDAQGFSFGDTFFIKIVVGQ